VVNFSQTALTKIIEIDVKHMSLLPGKFLQAETFLIIPSKWSFENILRPPHCR